ncbi:MAG TPA: acyl carrier protein [Candidatus Acidoferrum sp.]|nr:acyl carrier protein [Candidatus Acidoferrum sp.]
MVDTQVRLERCFAAALPTLSAAQIANASPASVAAWDSVASVTLFALVEEEFGVEIEVQDMQELLSFENLLGYLRRKTGESAA